MKTIFSKGNWNLLLLATMLLPLVLITSCKDDDPDDDPTPMVDPSSPVANFSSQVDAENSFTYAFENNSVVNGITDTSFDSAWDFGGDGTSSDVNPTFTFSEAGTYDVVLTITASDGETATASETIEVTAPLKRYASITDSYGDDNLNADGNTDTGELRVAMEAVANGRVTFNYRVTEGVNDAGNIKDAFINISGTSTSGDDAIVEVRLKDDAPHEFREGASDDDIAIANFPTGMADVWIPVEVSWAADGVGTPTFTVIIDGTTVVSDAVSTTNGGAGDVDGHLAATIDGAHTIQWKYSDNGSINDGQCHVDDIVIYSSDSGTETIVFEDNFQGRSSGDDLNPGPDAAYPLTPYHANTVDATVAEEE